MARKRKSTGNKFNVPLKSEPEQEGIDRVFEEVLPTTHNKSTEEAAPTEEIHVATKVSVNFRTAPSRDSEVIEVVEKGKEFKILRVLGDWLNVQEVVKPNRIGYLKTEFTQEV